MFVLSSVAVEEIKVESEIGKERKKEKEEEKKSQQQKKERTIQRGVRGRAGCF